MVGPDELAMFGIVLNRFVGGPLKRFVAGAFRPLNALKIELIIESVIPFLLEVELLLALFKFGAEIIVGVALDVLADAALNWL
jgi:hypothetical protein